MIKFGCLFLLGKPLLVHFCVVEWVLFSFFSIFCMTLFGDYTHPRHQETTQCFLFTPDWLRHEQLRKKLYTLRAKSKKLRTLLTLISSSSYWSWLFIVSGLFYKILMLTHQLKKFTSAKFIFKPSKPQFSRLISIHFLGEAPSPLACLLLARPFFLVPTTYKRLLRRLVERICLKWKTSFPQVIILLTLFIMYRYC